eukprot:254834_1
MASESDHSEQWEILSESSTTDSFHITSPIKQVTIIEDHQSNDNNDNDIDDNASIHSMESIASIASVHSLDSLQSATSSTHSSIEIVHASSQQPSSLIPQIDENLQLNDNKNELIPSYVDIEAELSKQRALTNELKSQLNDVTQQRDQVSHERDELKSRLDAVMTTVAQLRQTNVTIDRQNIVLRNMQIQRRNDKKRKIKKITSKSTVSLTNKRGHRPTVPAKLRFRRQRTTHRTVYVQGRRW